MKISRVAVIEFNSQDLSFCFGELSLDEKIQFISEISEEEYIDNNISRLVIDNLRNKA